MKPILIRLLSQSPFCLHILIAFFVMTMGLLSQLRLVPADSVLTNPAFYPGICLVM